MAVAEPRLSILIPVLGPFARMEQGLVSVLENRPDRCQVVLVFNGDYADPYELQDETTFVHAPQGAGPGEMIFAGLRRATAPVAHVLAAGAEVEPDWADVALAHFADPQVAAVAPLLVRGDDRARIVSAGIEYCPGGRRRCRAAGETAASAEDMSGAVFGASLAGGFFRRAALATALEGTLRDGYAAPWAEVDVALQLHAMGYATICEPESRIAVPAVDQQARRGWFTDGRMAQRMFLRHAAQTGWAPALARHPLALAGDGWLRGQFLGALARLAGRLTALAELPAIRRQARVRPALQGQTAPLPPHVRIDQPHGPQRSHRPTVKSDVRRATR